MSKPVDRAELGRRLVACADELRELDSDIAWLTALLLQRDEPLYRAELDRLETRHNYLTLVQRHLEALHSPPMQET